jgi:hypothetical protein
MKVLFQLCLLTLFIGLCAEAASACSCIRVKDEGKLDVEQYKKYWLEEYPGLVFSGQVIKTETVKVTADSIEKLKVTFRVERYWRGDGSPTAVIYTNTGCCACGIGYQKGEKYFVNAQLFQGLPQTNICSAFTKDDVDRFIRVVGEGRKPKSDPLSSPTSKPGK